MDNNMTEIYRILGSDDRMSISQAINKRRLSLGDISNLQIAAILNIKKSSFYELMSAIEQDKVEKVDFYDMLKVCQFFGIDIEEMSQLYVASLKSEEIAELEAARKAAYILNHFDVKRLKEVGFLNTSTDFNAIEQRITKFFGLSSITHYSAEIGAVAFSRTKNASQDKMREFWVRSAFYQFEKIANPNEYDKSELLSLIPKMAPYSRYVEKGFHHVLRALYNIGITVIIQSYLSGTQVRGGTFVVHGKPCIVITDFNKSYPHLWFALLHELYHVLYDFEQLAKLKYHLTGEVQSDLYLFREDYADMFGWEMLLPQEKLNFIKPLVSSQSYVVAYAKKNMIHPGIVYAAYCETTTEGKTEFGFYRALFGKSEKAVHVVKSNPWNKETIEEEIEKIEQSLTIKSE